MNDHPLKTLRPLHKGIALMLLAFLFYTPSRLEAADLTLSTYYPSPFGQYNSFRLLPRSVDLNSPCAIGSLYVNSLGNLQSCNNVNGSGAWGPLTEIWTQAGDNIYLTDTLSNPQAVIGVGIKTPVYKLTLRNDTGIIATGTVMTGTFSSGAILPALGAGSRLIWYPRKAAFRAGYADGTQWDDGNIGGYSVALGKNTIASGISSIAGGGDTNSAAGQYSVVSGGQQNTASGDLSAITGGQLNIASGKYATVSGRQNSATADDTTILGGWTNQASAIYTTIGGGAQNTVSTPYSNINGGVKNLIDGL